LIGRLAERVIANMSAQERRDLILAVVEKMMGQLSATERRLVMERVVDSFLSGLPTEERKATARELVPRLLGELMRSGDMTVDDLLGAAIGSLDALDAPAADDRYALPE
jgi:hypothetical protein